jgi:hypothetical protein
MANVDSGLQIARERSRFGQLIIPFRRCESSRMVLLSAGHSINYSLSLANIIPATIPGEHGWLIPEGMPGLRLLKSLFEPVVSQAQLQSVKFRILHPEVCV